VQRVSGSYYGNFYMPCAAGVGYSYSPYRVVKDSDPSAGMLRLVMGLGTSAVDRTEGSYPRIVNLDMPERTVYTTCADRHRYSQGKAEVVNTSQRRLERLPSGVLEPLIPVYLKNILFEHDFDAESRQREMGRDREVRFISCKGLVENREITGFMRRLLHTIQREYEYPVDIEFTINISDNGEYSIDLLQCRPLQVMNTASEAKMPDDIPPEHVLLESKGASMGISKASKLDIIVYVDPVAYYEMPYNKKNAVAALIGKINWQYRDKDMHMMLIVPGRVGTSSPELGVPTAFSDISAFEVICELEETRAGYDPELSYGSHIFQDLVEAKILYTAVFHNQKTLRFAPESLSSARDITDSFGAGDELAGIVTVYDVSGLECRVYNDIANEHLLITI
ncbi:MAG: phosphoenolpyruvate synthase, partial [Ruminiclostridium sp.]|nr:phosphoenolpyruvate synthase [Ruminiclostridium sp.]